MANSADSDQLASSVCKGRVYPGSAGLGLKQNLSSMVSKIGTTLKGNNLLPE